MHRGDSTRTLSQGGLSQPAGKSKGSRALSLSVSKGENEEKRLQNCGGAAAAASATAVCPKPAFGPTASCDHVKSQAS